MQALKLVAPSVRPAVSGAARAASGPSLAVLYVVADLRLGGAQTGLLRLLDLGFLDPGTTHLLSLGPADPLIREGLEQRGPWAGLTVLGGGPAPARWAAGAAILARLLRTGRPRIVMLSLEPANLVGRALRPFFPEPVFCSFEHSSRYRRRLYHLLFPLLARGIDVVFHDSLATRRGIEPYYRLAKPDWLELPLFVSDPAKPIKTSYEVGATLRLLSVGRLVPAKGQTLLLEVVDLLRRRGLGVRCEIVGEGPLRAALERQRERLGLDDHVVLPGQDGAWQERAPEFDIYVQTSEHEGACLAVLEAMQAGLPIVSTAAGDIPRHLANGAGIVVADRRPEALAEAIAALARDSAARADLGRRAAARIRSLYARERVAAALAAVRRRLGLAPSDALNESYP